MDLDSSAGVYDRAGFGRPVQRGSRPVVVVVDFSYGFTDDRYPTGADLSGPVLATARLLEVARADGVPVVFTTIAYDPGQIRDLAWL
ncbi:MAG: carbamoylsarcosine amidase [Modestobacter sp.]|nr:carbamoylsarcosine amidase [Modestobacter sp.]